MTIGVNVLTSGSRGVNLAANQATAAFTPTSAALILAVIGTVDGTFPAAVPSAAAQANNGQIAYQLLDSQGVSDGGFGDQVSIWYGWNPAAGASGALTWTIAASAADTMAWWIVYGLTGVRADLGGIGASFGNKVKGSGAGTGYTAGLASVDARGDSQVFAFAYHASEEVTTPEAGWTEDLDATVAGGGTGHAQHRLNDSGATATWATSSTFVAMAVEVLAARSLAPNPARPRRQTCRRRSGLVLARP